MFGAFAGALEAAPAVVPPAFEASFEPDCGAVPAGADPGSYRFVMAYPSESVGIPVSGLTTPCLFG